MLKALEQLALTQRLSPEVHSWPDLFWSLTSLSPLCPSTVPSHPPPSHSDHQLDAHSTAATVLTLPQTSETHLLLSSFTFTVPSVRNVLPLQNHMVSCLISSRSLLKCYLLRGVFLAARTKQCSPAHCSLTRHFSS